MCVIQDSVESLLVTTVSFVIRSLVSTDDVF